MEIPELKLEILQDNPMCFGCGRDNPHGLKIKTINDGEKIKVEFLPEEFHQGWPGHVHGGALMTALDECIGKAVYSQGIWAVTASIEIRLKSMARIGEPLIVDAQVTKRTSRTVEVEAKMNRQDNSVVAEAKALMYIVK
ncbi:MAG: PaaI family thioesterase [Dehalococcoidales bacterium]|nr:PaaI family thioesterase [Dehalococcoidales bacterium]